MKNSSQVRNVVRPFTFAMIGLVGMSGCAGEALRGKVAGIQTQLQRAIADGSKARGCAPKETALAEANIKFAEDALAMGEYFRGSEHVRQAAGYTELAQRKTNPEICRGGAPMVASIGDRDGDGYDDKADKCPDDPEDFDSFEDEDGCPDKDNDGDGVLDAARFEGGRWVNLDTKDGTDCRNDAEDVDNFEDEDGCPDPDNDKDGILDRSDKCPNEPEDIDNFEDDDGCPDPDNDRDKILDVDDKCPNEPEDYDGDEDEDGCPDLAAKLDGCRIRLDDKVYFRFDKWEIDAKSFGLLNDVATILKTFPEMQIEIGGHTDSKGGDKYNRTLSQKRVDAVMRYLTGRNINASRMRAVGYGESMPIDSNRTAEGRALNRRVEFNRIDGACSNK
jgi:outer membrane protein OmpA-like peptidoglycan-associated protein